MHGQFSDCPFFFVYCNNDCQMDGYKHETKTCPRCGQAFECKAGDIAHCQCKEVKLADKAYDLISKKYDDCLCKHCLQQLSQAFYLTLEQQNFFKDR
jgi:hypothetical protein